MPAHLSRSHEGPGFSSLPEGGCGPVGGLAEAGLELGPPEVWPGGSFWPPSPLFLLLFPGTENSAEDLETGLDAVTTRAVWRPSLKPTALLSGPMSSWGRGRLQDARGRAFPSSPSSPWPARGMVTNTDRGWDLSVRAGGSLVQMGQQRWREGRTWPRPCPVRTEGKQDALTRKASACL